MKGFSLDKKNIVCSLFSYCLNVLTSWLLRVLVYVALKFPFCVQFKRSSWQPETIILRHFIA